MNTQAATRLVERMQAFWPRPELTPVQVEAWLDFLEGLGDPACARTVIDGLADHSRFMPTRADVAEGYQQRRRRELEADEQRALPGPEPDRSPENMERLRSALAACTKPVPAPKDHEPVEPRPGDGWSLRQALRSLPCRCGECRQEASA